MTALKKWELAGARAVRALELKLDKHPPVRALGWREARVRHCGCQTVTLIAKRQHRRTCVKPNRIASRLTHWETICATRIRTRCPHLRPAGKFGPSSQSRCFRHWR